MVREHPAADPKMKKTTEQTITRLESGKMQLTDRWANVLAPLLGASVADLFATPLSTDADRVTDADVTNAKALAIAGMRTVIAPGNMLEEIGIRAGQPITIVCSEDAISAVETGDVVLISVKNPTPNGHLTIETLRQFVAPSLAITNRRRSNLIHHLGDHTLEARIIGVAIRDWD